MRFVLSFNFLPCRRSLNFTHRSGTYCLTFLTKIDKDIDLKHTRTRRDCPNDGDNDDDDEERFSRSPLLTMYGMNVESVWNCMVCIEQWRNGGHKCAKRMYVQCQRQILEKTKSQRELSATNEKQKSNNYHLDFFILLLCNVRTTTFTQKHTTTRRTDDPLKWKTNQSTEKTTMMQQHIVSLNLTSA